MRSQCMRNLMRALVAISVVFVTGCGEISTLQTNLKDFNTESKRSISLMKKANDMLEGSSVQTQPSVIPTTPPSDAPKKLYSFEPSVEAIKIDEACGKTLGSQNFAVTAKNADINLKNLKVLYQNPTDIEEIKVFLIYQEAEKQIGSINPLTGSIELNSKLSNYQTGILSLRIKLKEGLSGIAYKAIIELSYESLGITKIVQLSGDEEISKKCSEAL